MVALDFAAVVSGGATMKVKPLTSLKRPTRAHFQVAIGHRMML